MARKGEKGHNAHHLEGLSPNERFDKFTPHRHENDCWIWNGPRNNYGYGSFSLNSKAHIASRWIYEYLYGPVGSLVVDHVCNNRPCVNPYHLRAITNRANILRGDCRGGKNIRKTHCLRGHPLFGENLYRAVNGTRQCRACHTFRERRRLEKQRQAGHLA